MTRVLGNVEALLADIHKRAQQRGLNREADAQQRAGTIAQKAEQKRAELSKSMLLLAEQEIHAQRQRLLAQGDLEAKRLFLNERESLLEGVWQEAEARLRKLVASADYIKVLASLAQLAALELGHQEIRLSADPSGHEFLHPENLTSWAKESNIVFTRADHPADIWGGLLATHGRERYDVSFTSRLALAREVLREQVFQKLTSQDYTSETLAPEPP